jgi:hypothetical protein
MGIHKPCVSNPTQGDESKALRTGREHKSKKGSRPQGKGKYVIYDNGAGKITKPGIPHVHVLEDGGNY